MHQSSKGAAGEYQKLISQYTGRTYDSAFLSYSNTSSGYGVMVLSRIPILESETHSIGRNSWDPIRPGVRVKVSIGGRAINFFGAHCDISRTFTDGYLLENISNLLSWAGTFGGDKLLGGDFNAWEYGTAGQKSAIDQMRAQYTDSAFDLGYNDSTAPVTIDNNWRPDYVFRTSGVRATALNVYPTSLSDHHLVVLDYKLQ